MYRGKNIHNYRHFLTLFFAPVWHIYDHRDACRSLDACTMCVAVPGCAHSCKCLLHPPVGENPGMGRLNIPVVYKVRSIHLPSFTKKTFIFDCPLLSEDLHLQESYGHNIKGFCNLQISLHN